MPRVVFREKLVDVERFALALFYEFLNFSVLQPPIIVIAAITETLGTHLPRVAVQKVFVIPK